MMARRPAHYQRATAIETFPLDGRADRCRDGAAFV